MDAPWLRQVLAENVEADKLDVNAVKFDLVRFVTSWACCSCTCNTSKPKYSAAGAKQEEELASTAAAAADASDAEAARQAPHEMRERHCLSPEERVRVGRECKRILDYGRVLWLRRQGLHAELVHFCAPGVYLASFLP